MNRIGYLTLGFSLLVMSACKDSPTDILPTPKQVAFTCASGSVTTENGENIPVAPNGFAVVGNQIISSRTCTPVRLLGVSRPGLHYSPSSSSMQGAKALQEFGNIKDWGSNTVRITVSQLYGVPSAKFYDPEYMGRVDEAVKRALEVGLNVIVALQVSDRGDPNYPGTQSLQQPMPDVNHSVPFWRELAAMYKDQGKVIFELYSEPYASKGPPEPKNRDWDMWLNGGFYPEGEVYDEVRKGYQAVGMQQLYDEVRATGADNLVILSGLQWGYYLDGVPAHRVQGYNIAYAAHPWDWSEKQPSAWNADWGFLSITDPVILSEFGDYNCNQNGYTTKVLNYADKYNLSWIGWAWTAPGDDEENREQKICEYPMLLQDMSGQGTPSSYGKFIRDRLLSY